MANLPDSDQDNADLLVNTHQDNIRYCIDSGAWFVWDNSRWVMDPNAIRVSNLWTQLARQFPDQIANDNPNAKEPYKKYLHKKYSLNYNGQRNTINTAKNDPRIHVYQGDFDSHAYELNTPKGIVDLHTGRLLASNKSNLHTKTTPISPDYTTQPKRFLAFLNEVFQKDKELIEYMHALFGLSLIGEVVEQIFPFALGPGGTGKSTLFGVIQDVMGDYATSSNSTLVMRNRNDHPEQVASLQGVRAIFMSELNESDRIDEAKLKSLTGNDTISARYMRQNSFSFRPSHTLFLAGNTTPHANGSDSGLWRRMKPVPFKAPKFNRIDKTLRSKLVELEGPQILAWLIKGATRYLESNSLVDAQVVKDAAKDYEYEEDALAQFIDEQCLIADNAGPVSYKVFRHRYADWCEDNGIRYPLGIKTLTQRLTNNPKYGNITTGKIDRSTRGYFGIALLEHNQRINVR